MSKTPSQQNCERFSRNLLTTSIGFFVAAIFVFAAAFFYLVVGELSPLFLLDNLLGFAFAFALGFIFAFAGLTTIVIYYSDKHLHEHLLGISRSGEEKTS